MRYQNLSLLAFICDPSRSPKVKSDGANRKPVGPTTKCSPGSNLVSVTVFEIFRVKMFTVDLLALVGLTPGPKVTKKGDDQLPTQINHPTKFQPYRRVVITSTLFTRLYHAAKIS